MTNVPGYTPECCPAGNGGVYWIVKDDHKSNGLGAFEDGWTGWDGFDGWGMGNDGPGFFPVAYCPWCGQELGDPFSYALQKFIPVATARIESQTWLDQDIAQRQKEQLELRNEP